MAVVDTPLGRFDMGGSDVSQMLVDEIWRDRIYENEHVCIQPGDVVFDCGSHVGFFTRYALMRGAARVLAFEADPENADLFERNLESEINAGVVSLMRAAVWYSHDSLPLWRDTGHSVSSTVEPRARDLRRSYEQHGEVATIALDSLAFWQGPDFIKLDIEGAEKQALLGAERTIRRYRPRIAASIYHLNNDFIDIPQLIQAFVPDYRHWTRCAKVDLFTCLSSQAAQKHSSPSCDCSQNTANASAIAV